ncbi:SdpI family protein [Sanguibacter sp. 25GB23B1]|uniref:SdpI family protein n=1 Tax=unclassified Sanguibacter TaxID=2645534 RepID=UPI0032AF524D
MIVGMVGMLGGTVLLPAVTLPLTRQAADGRLALNHTAGIRTRATKSSDEAWRVGHAAALPVLAPAVPVAVVSVVLAVALQVLAGGMWGFAVAATGFVAETLLILRSAWVADRAARLVGG